MCQYFLGHLVGIHLFYFGTTAVASVFRLCTVSFRAYLCCSRHGTFLLDPAAALGSHPPLAHEVAMSGSCRGILAWCVVCSVHPAASVRVRVGKPPSSCLFVRPFVVIPCAGRFCDGLCFPALLLAPAPVLQMTAPVRRGAVADARRGAVADARRRAVADARRGAVADAHMGVISVLFVSCTIFAAYSQVACRR